ncbi:MAG: alpha/beta fold hydrolase [Proteobacteria bacterium]|nr:alpha/beta fold hydrolase [Pseudomonadota bacterium]
MIRRFDCLLLIVLLLSGCVSLRAPSDRPMGAPGETTGLFDMPDGTRLPYRVWRSNGPVRAVILALHGMNDSRDAWEVPAPHFIDAGVTLFSPDLRGFGATTSRGQWPGTAELVDDTRAMIALLRARYPGLPLFLMGESMGAATLMVLATQPRPPPIDGYILVAPAVWSRNEMNWVMRSTLWLAYNTMPGVALTGGGFVKRTASDNREALIRLSTDPLTIHGTRVDAIEGLVDLMDQAAAAARHFHARALFLYGGRDELVPPRATASVWRALPLGGATLAFYPQGYHLLLRDKDRTAPINDVLAWMQDSSAPLPSGADKAAPEWLEKQDRK